MVRNVLAASAALVVALSLPAQAKDTVSFREDVLPLLQFRCGVCHQPGGEGLEKSGFGVTGYSEVMKGTKFGPMVRPGDPQTSNLMAILDGKTGIKMPHGKKKLSTCDRDTIRTWILEGAKDN